MHAPLGSVQLGCYRPWKLRLRAEALLPVRPEGSLCQRACGVSNRMMSNWWTSSNTAIHLQGGFGELSAHNLEGYDGSLHMRHKGRFGTQSISDIIFMRRGVTF